MIFSSQNDLEAVLLAKVLLHKVVFFLPKIVYKGLFMGMPIAIKVLKESPDNKQLIEFKHEIEMLR